MALTERGRGGGGGGDDAKVTAESLRAWTKKTLASYKCPSALVVVEEIPRNAMGKVNKRELKKLFEATR